MHSHYYIDLRIYCSFLLIDLQCWLRLTRIQKSFLLMLVMVLVIFSVILTSFSWIPDQRQNRNLPDYLNSEQRRAENQLHQSSSVGSDGSVNKDHVFQQEEPNILAHQDHDPIETGHGHKSDKNPWDGLPLAKDDLAGEEPVDNFIDSKKEEEVDVIDEKIEIKVTTISPSSSSSTTSSTTAKPQLDLKVRNDSIIDVLFLDRVLIFISCRIELMNK